MEQIQTQQNFASSGRQTTSPDLRLHITQPDLQLRIRPCDLALQIEPPEVVIDLRQSFESMGLLDNAALARSCAAEAREAVGRGISRRVREGKGWLLRPCPRCRPRSRPDSARCGAFTPPAR